MRKTSFTLMEIMVVLIVVGILATVSISSYRNFVEDSKAKICRANMETLVTALDVYALEHDIMPASLSQLPQQYIDKAYAQVMRKQGWGIKLARLVADWDESGLAYADSFLRALAKGNIQLITCPKDSTPPAAGGNSYGMNSLLANMSSGRYRALSADMVLIGDCAQPAFSSNSDLTQRHNHFVFFIAQPYAQAISKGKDPIIEGVYSPFKKTKPGTHTYGHQ
ncbi:MAG: prepilin-type N-terminal cleavage/methylation domain-containing protein [Candidatus Omnitrophota bacterium]